MARLLFFGKLGELAGARMRDWALSGDTKTVALLIEAIALEDRTLGEAIAAPSVRCIVNERLAARDATVSDSDEIAFLPPVSGG